MKPEPAMNGRGLLLVIAIIAVLAALVLWPNLDLMASGWFYQPGTGFLLAQHPLFLFMQNVAYYGARILGAALALAALISYLRHRPFAGLDTKAWLFLFLALLLGPGLIANVGFKDHWGRARPREVTEFGGHAAFSPALTPQATTHTNSSFVSGDASFGFYLPAFAYVVTPSRRRRTFWSCIGLGTWFGFCRLAMGAHFLSDILFAATFMLASTAALHALMYKATSTGKLWRHWIGLPQK